MHREGGESVFKSVVVALVCLSASAALADIFDNFDSYATGPVTAVSGGAWRTWENVGGDAQVVTGGLSAPNALQMTKVAGTASDVVAYSPANMLGHLGATATWSFDFNVVRPDNNDIDSYFFAGSGDAGTNDTFYDGGSFIFIADFGTHTGTTSLNIWDGLGTGGPFGNVTLSSNLSVGAWHNVQLIATQSVADMTANDPNAPDGTFNVYLDNTLVTPAALNFRMNRAEGLNAFEIYEIDSVTSTQQYHLYDNVSLTPEPAALGLLALGLLLRRR
jgi:hypothetical protein